MNELSEYYISSCKKIVEKIKTELLSKGEYLCQHAQNNGDYKDVTGTLRSSFAFRMYDNGKIVADHFANNISTDKPQTEDPQMLAVDALEENSPAGNGISIVLVAGAKYSKFVEDKGYNVMHLTIEEAKKIIEEIIQSP